MQRGDFFELARDNHEDEEGRTEHSVHSIKKISRINSKIYRIEKISSFCSRNSNGIFNLYFISNLVQSINHDPNLIRNTE